jgi:GH25 family lysozyme M1 (1,4-beta-N-acetylmuramidase)
MNVSKRILSSAVAAVMLCTPIINASADEYKAADCSVVSSTNTPVGSVNVAGATMSLTKKSNSTLSYSVAIRFRKNAAINGHITINSPLVGDVMDLPVNETDIKSLFSSDDCNVSKSGTYTLYFKGTVTIDGVVDNVNIHSDPVIF